MKNPDNKFSRAIAEIDEANSQDPDREVINGKEVPGELLYSRRMTSRLEEYEPEASEALKLAARCQHIERWAIPRGDYPMNRVGYIKWRNELKSYHASRAGEIMARAGYSQEMIKRVSDLLKKKGLRTDPEAGILEDVICLVFLEHYLDDFSNKHDEKKIVEILQKTWKKMTDRGKAAALELKLPPSTEQLVIKALQ